MATLEINIIDKGKVFATHSFENIPNDTLNKLMRAAAEQYPDSPKKEAWSTYIFSCIQNLVGSAKAFILYDIPERNYFAFSDILSRLSIDMTGLMRRIFASAPHGRLHIINYVPIDENRKPISMKDEDSHVVIINGFNDDIWKRFDEAAKQIPSDRIPNTKMSGEELLATMLEQGSITVQTKTEPMQ